MPTSAKDHSAAVVLQRWLDFQNALSGERKYPVQQFKSFVEAARRYIELSKGDPLIHRNVAKAINGLTDFLEVERKRVPGHVLCEAERLECLLFGEYDPHFEGESLLGCEGKLGFSGVDRADAVVLAARFALDAVSESALLQWQNLVCLRASPLEW